MFDLHVLLDNRPGELARFGQAMGSAEVSLEGGGVFTLGGEGHAHFLVDDGERARAAAQAAGLEVVAVREVLVRRLKQEQPGQLGAIATALARAGINIITQYSDHANQLILVVDDLAQATEATADWAP
ncbi:MAG: amino acid-binding protein [Sphingomonas sp.]|nr:amino acid-binding protein [Sphingomonas sp.]